MCNIPVNIREVIFPQPPKNINILAGKTIWQVIMISLSGGTQTQELIPAT